jgi:hypothetical protein
VSYFSISKIGYTLIPVALVAVYHGLTLTPCFRLDPTLVKNMKQKKDNEPEEDNMLEVPATGTELVRVV